MHKLSRSLFAGFMAMGALVACDDVETTPPAPQVSAVNVVPQNVQLSVGQTATLTATVLGDAGLENRSVTWRSANPAVATVDNAGVVRAVAAGQTTIIATSAADPNVSGAASVVVTAAAIPAVSIASITKNGLPVDINNVQGQVDVTLNVAGNGAQVGRVDLLVQCPNNTAPVLVQSQTFSNGQAPNGPITLSFNSARLNTVAPAPGTRAEFSNGPCNVIARLFNTAGQQITEAGDAVRPITLQNQNYAAVTITASKGPQPDQAGQPWVDGNLTVSVVPVLFSGATASSGTVTITGTATDGTPLSVTKTISSLGTLPATVTFTEGTDLPALTFPNLQVTTSFLNAQNIQITPVPTQFTTAGALNYDNQAPIAGTLSLNTQGAAFNWVGEDYIFPSGLGGGSSAAVAASRGYVAGTTPQGGNDFGGVDRVTVTFEAVRINTNTQTCSAAGTTGLTFVTNVDQATDLTSSPVNGVSPNGESYCGRYVETDALGNTRTTYLTSSFGVDLEDPRLIRTAGVANNSSFDINGLDEVPADAFPVAGTAAAAPGATYAFTLRDTLSGFDATPVNYSIRRQTAAGTACVIGTGTSCSPTDGAQTVVVDSIDRTALISVTGGSATEGYYTFNGTFRDQAANAGAALPTRTILVDATAPTVSRIGSNIPGGGLQGNTTATFNFDAQDNLDLYLANSVLLYGSVQIRSADQQIGTPFDGTLTTSVSAQPVTFANFYRSLTQDPNAAGVKPSSVFVRVTDAATNQTQSASRAIDPQDVANSSYIFAADTVRLQAFQIVTAQNGTLASPNCDDDIATCTVTVRVQGPSGTFENPFANGGGVNLYRQDPVTGDLVLIAPTNTTGSQTDNGVNRFYTYTFNIPTQPAGTPYTVFAIGFTRNGDAILSNPFPITFVP